MANFTGRSKPIQYLFQNGGGGGGSCKVISGYYHNGSFYEDQSYTQVITGDTECLYIDLDTTTLYLFDGTDYVEVQGGGGSGGGSFACDLLLENTDFSITSGSGAVERQYTLSASIENYDGVLVVGFTNVNANEQNQAVSMIVLKASYNIGSSVRWTYILNGSIPSNNRRLAFGFSDSTTIQTAATRQQYEEPRLYRVYGLKFGGSLHTYSTTEQIVGTWIDGKPIYEKTLVFLDNRIVSGDNFLATGISDMELVIDVRAFMTNSAHISIRPINTYEFNATQDSLFYEINMSTGEIRIRGNGTWPTPNIYFTIQYTKTTDT